MHLGLIMMKIIIMTITVKIITTTRTTSGKERILHTKKKSNVIRCCSHSIHYAAHLALKQPIYVAMQNAASTDQYDRRSSPSCLSVIKAEE